MFSNMNFTQNTLRNQITDENLDTYLKLKTTCYAVNIIKHSKEMQFMFTDLKHFISNNF